MVYVDPVGSSFRKAVRDFEFGESGSSRLILISRFESAYT